MMYRMIICVASVAIVVIEMMSPLPLWAQESGPPRTIEAVYKHFRYTSSPKAALRFAQEAALWLSEQGEAGLPEFDKPGTRWGMGQVTGRDLSAFVIDCSQGMVVTHPNPRLHKLKHIEGLAKSFKDFQGRLVALDCCQKVEQQPKGVFCTTYTVWVRSVTGLRDPQYMFRISVKVPNLPYEIVVALPYEASSRDELDMMAAELTMLVDDWSLID